MKIGLFSDPHYCKADDVGLNRRPALSLGKIKEAMESFKEQDVEICFCLGDLVDHAPGDTKNEILENLNEALILIRSYNIPFYLVPGNHDFVDLTRQDFKNAGLLVPDACQHITIETDKCVFVILDANVRSSGYHFDVAGHVWDDAFISDFEVQLIKKDIPNNKSCIVLVHENLDPTVEENHIIKNGEAVRRAIKESGAVKLVIQGHYHYGSDYYDGDIHYHTLKAMCLGEDNYYEIIEI